MATSKTGKFGALADFRQQKETETSSAVAEPPLQSREVASPQPALARGRGRPAGKRSNPEFEPTTVLLRKQTKRAASRKLEDVEANKDLSELIEDLLNKWIARS
jgi:hypothetical protein